VLSREDNELVTRVGPGTPMGHLMRQYWVPALLSSELPQPDCEPVRVMLLGEKLLALRASTGQVGLLQHNCPHRGASLFFGRNEEGGLRCVYHGWKFDTTGACIDMPNEPAESDFRTRVRAVSYPTRERGGLVWAYLGPRETPPPLPDLEANMVEGATARCVQQECNWLQVLEGDIDTSHAGFLHRGSLNPDDMPAGTFMEYQIRDRAPKYELVNTVAGATYGGYRDAMPGYEYWRIAQFLFPFYSMAPAGLLGLAKGAICRVPMDDEHTMNYFLSPQRRQSGQANPSAGDGEGGLPRMHPPTTDWFGRWRTIADKTNDYEIDRAIQRRNQGRQGYSGIKGTTLQDRAITESMGTIFDRSSEHLGSSDSMVIRVRRRLISAATALQRDGVVPPGVDQPEAYAVRAGGTFLAKGVNWLTATAELRKAFVEHPDLDPSVVGVA
jgi:phthalate 4,5-dioxygenase oxygenase subunit